MCLFKLIYLFLVALGLHCCVQAFSSCGEQRLLSSCDAQASHCSGKSCCRAWALNEQASVVVVDGLSRPVACGILPAQGLSTSSSREQADSEPLDRQGSPAEGISEGPCSVHLSFPRS